MAGRRYSFVLPPVIEKQLLEIKTAADLENPSAAMRHCIQVAHQSLKAASPETASAAKPGQLDTEGLKFLKKVLILEKFILVEISKLHNGKAVLTSEGQAYLEELNRKVKENLKEVGRE